MFLEPRGAGSEREHVTRRQSRKCSQKPRRGGGRGGADNRRVFEEEEGARARNALEMTHNSVHLVSSAPLSFLNIQEPAERRAVSFTVSQQAPSPPCGLAMQAADASSAAAGCGLRNPVLLVGRRCLSKVATNSCRLKLKSAKSLETFGRHSSHLAWFGSRSERYSAKVARRGARLGLDDEPPPLGWSEAAASGV